MTPTGPASLSVPSCSEPELTDGLDRLGLALADPIRREILIRLLDGSQCPSDLAVAIGTSRSNLSNHLTCLRGCGLVRSERCGRRAHYELVSEQLADAVRALLAVALTLLPCDELAPASARSPERSSRRG